MRMNAIKVIWNEFCHYNMRKVGQNSLKQHNKSHSNAFKFQFIANSSVIWILTHLYLLDKFVNVLYMQVKSSETICGQFKVHKPNHNCLKTHLEPYECVRVAF